MMKKLAEVMLLLIICCWNHLYLMCIHWRNHVEVIESLQY